MSLLFNTLSRFVTVLLPRSNHLLISWLQSPSTVTLEPKKRKSVTTNGARCHDLSFLIFRFKPVLSLYSFTLIMRLFSSSSASAIRVVSSAYLRLLMFLLPVLIPACNSSSVAFLMMCSAYRLNIQGDSIQPSCSPFSILRGYWGLCRRLGSFPGSGRSPGEGNGYPLQYSCLENSMDRGGLQSKGLQRVRHDWVIEQQQFLN